MRRRQWWWLLAVPAVALFVLRVCAVRNFRIPTGSMEPTVLSGDYVVANMAAYGLRLPFVSSVFFGPRVPRRGDVVVYRFPEDPSRLFLHRVIGLPGEQIEIRGKVVWIDGRALDEPYTQFIGDESPMLRRFGPERVPADHLFILGDNRDNARDSRFWGFLKVEEVRGKAWRLYFSQDPRDGTTRWDRIGRAIR